MGERLKPPVLKTGSPQGLVGSNPTLSEMLGWRSGQSHQAVNLAGASPTEVQILSPAPFWKRAKVLQKVLQTTGKLSTEGYTSNHWYTSYKRPKRFNQIYKTMNSLGLDGKNRGRKVRSFI